MIFNEHMARMYEANPEGSAMSGNLLPVPFVEALRRHQRGRCS